MRNNSFLFYLSKYPIKNTYTHRSAVDFSYLLILLNFLKDRNKNILEIENWLENKDISIIYKKEKSYYQTRGLSMVVISPICVCSPSTTLFNTSIAACLCKYSLLFPHLYEYVHLGQPLSLLHGHSDNILNALIIALSNLSYNALLAPFPPTLPS